MKAKANPHPSPFPARISEGQGSLKKEGSSIDISWEREAIGRKDE